MEESAVLEMAAGRYDFGLSTTQEAHAAKLHRESIVFDMLSQHAGGSIFAHYPAELQAEFREHIATLTGSRLMAETVYWPFEMAWRGRSDLIGQWFEQSGLTCGTFDLDLIIHDVSDPLSCHWEERILRYAELPWLRYIRSAAEIRQAKRDGVVAIYANYQPVIPVLRDLKSFDRAYAKGLRSFTLTYNRMDHVGVGCTERVDAGLSMFGVEVVEHCNEIGVIVDVSHCGRLTTLDACRHSSEPVNANHTMARALYDHPRGKTNEELRAIADTGGVIGVVALPYFLSEGPSPTIEHMLDHIDYIADLIGWEHVGLGTDWPLQMPPDVLVATLGATATSKNLGWSQQYRRDVTQRLVGFEDCRDLPNITRGLIKRGYSEEQIRGILGENALRVFAAVCG